ncbi:MAG: HyaD/HybD family hydrogenase maturation endopeptidase [bacterium]
MHKNIIVLGLGNILLKDEGIGVHIAQEMVKKSLPENVKVIDAGTASLYAFSKLKNINKLIIVDAVRGGKKPGTVYRMDSRDLPAPACPDSAYLSLHHINVSNVLRITEKMGNVPEETVIIGVEPKEIDWGMELTPDIKQKVPDIVNTVLEEL